MSGAPSAPGAGEPAPGFLFERVADGLARQIAAGVYAPGDRLPGVRRLAAGFGVGVSTAVSALHLLEDRGLVEARPRSGHFVLAAAEGPDLSPGPAEGEGMSAEAEDPGAQVGDAALSLAVLQAEAEGDALQLGAAEPSAALLPVAALRRSFHAVLRARPEAAVSYDFPPGDEGLRVQIARRMAAAGVPAAPEEVLPTTGAQEALRLALQAVAAPGDRVAVETPSFYGIHGLIRAMGLRAVEVPTDARSGLDLDALGRALDREGARAVIAMPSFGNPLGQLMPDAAKAELVAMLARRGATLIEDDVYGDLAWDGRRPAAARAWDPEGATVIHCSGFSKTLGSGLRVGWMLPGRFRARVERLKFASTLASPSLQTLALADFLARGGYQRYLRRIQRDCARQTTAMRRAVLDAFPRGTRCTRPRGGFVLWVELPEGGDAMALHARALAEGISLAPGPMFSAQPRFRRCLRLNCALPWDARLARAVARLGRLAAETGSGPGTGRAPPGA